MRLENVPAHGHCEICHQPITAGDRFCGSVACEEKHQQQLKERKREVYKFVGMLAAVIIIVTLMQRFG